jgi:dTDP-4-dehydrorhamnose reductase
VEHEIADPVGTGQDRVLITGAGGQLGAALAKVFPKPVGDARTRDVFDVTTSTIDFVPGLVLHAAAWTAVDDAEKYREQAKLVNVQGTENVVALGAPVVYYSTDYVFDGEKGEPYVESDKPNPLSVYGRTKLAGEAVVDGKGWVIRSSWLFGATGKNFMLTMLKLAEQQPVVSVVDDQIGSPTYVGHLADVTRQILELPYGVYHVAAQGSASWADFAEAIFEEANIECQVRRIKTSEFPREAKRPAYSVLRSERGAPELPHWREGVKAALKELRS